MGVHITYFCENTTARTSRGHETVASGHETVATRKKINAADTHKKGGRGNAEIAI
jgi:hypothetical protein